MIWSLLKKDEYISLFFLSFISLFVNLKKAIKIVDKTYLIDNSRNKAYLITKFQFDKVLSIKSKKIPNWIRQNNEIYQKIETFIKTQAKKIKSCE